jgi:diguanylate cyclase (GGDEF)-like protein
MGPSNARALSRVRFRLLLLASVLVIVGAVWYASGQERRAVTTGDANTQTASDLLTGMLNQESGLRGYLLTGHTEFLGPYASGRQQVERALIGVAGDTAGAPDERAVRDAQASAARTWQAAAENEIADSLPGRPNTSLSKQTALKAMFDRFRSANARYHQGEVSQRDASLSRAGTTLVLIIVVLAALFGGVGYLFLERSNRRAARAARRDKADQRKQGQFTELLQVTRSEGEAHALLKRHLERSVPGSGVVVLNRNNSANRLEATTPVSPDTLFAESLAGARPEDCLAIRMARGHERIEESADEELLVCELCGAYAQRTMCLPSLVGGEVIGSVLISLSAALDERQGQQVSLSVTQAAPVLANLRTLAIAENQAATDALTGLSNARALQDTVKRLVAQAQRTGEPLVAVALDLDHFKEINDQYGHEAGDDVLAAVGEALTASLRGPEDFGGRAGGEEFLALLPNTDRAGALAYAERLRGVIGAITVPAVERKVTASLGVALMPEDALTDKDLLRRADRALYTAKRNGRNRVESAQREIDPHPDGRPAPPVLAA